MPYEIQKIANTKLYKVINLETREIKANATTKKNALRQVRLLKSYEKDKKKWIR
jgi:hypothetical protein